MQDFCCIHTVLVINVEADAPWCNKKQGETPMAVPGNLRGCADSGRASELALQDAGRDLEPQESGRAICCTEGGAGQGGQNNKSNQRQRSMKTDMTQELKSALDKCEAIEAALIKERKFLEDSATELHALQHTIELSDLAQVQRMTTLLTIAEVGGPRRTYRHQ